MTIMNRITGAVIFSIALLFSSPTYSAMVPLEVGNTVSFFENNFFSEWAGTATYQGFQLGVPTGGLVTQGSVTPSNVSLLFSLNLDSFTKANLPGLPNWFTTVEFGAAGNISGIGFIPGTGTNQWGTVFRNDGGEFIGAVDGSGVLQASSNALGTYDTIFISVFGVSPGIDVNFQGVGDETSFIANSFIPVAPVPLPASIWLFGSGLVGLASAARRRNA